MLPETQTINIASPEFTLHWAQWWGITLARLLNAPVGTDERRKAYNLHETAKSQLAYSLGFPDRRAES